MTAHFYHIYADGQWQAPVHEHLKALRDSRFSGSVHVGIVGSPDNRDAAVKYVSKFWSWDFDLCASADSGFEQVTLSALRRYAHRSDAAPSILYAHTKGAHDESVEQDNWREAMTGSLVRHWKGAVEYLGEYDAVGLHWLTPEDFPEKVTTPFFGGNFWWAATAYLRTLPEPGTESRFDAEAWIGLGNPKVVNLKAGWPLYRKW